MAIPERLQLRQKLQRSAREWIRIFGEEMDKPRQKGLGSDGSRSLVNWIETKNIRTELSTLSLAFAIRTNILKEGIAPTNIISITNERFMNEFGEKIADDYMASMEDYVIDNIKRLEERFK